MINLTTFGLYEMENSDDQSLIIQKVKEYKNYIDLHIINVNRSFKELFLDNYEKFPEDFRKFIDICKSHIGNHDMSKYSDEEFDFYRKNFYPINDEEKKNNEYDFERAWRHHYLNNPHHPDYWQETNSDMSINMIIEMICDWESFKYIQKGSAIEYWRKNANSIVITDPTRMVVNRIFTILNKE